MGIRHPVPNAREVTFRTGAACFRLNSAMRTSRNTRRTVCLVETLPDDLLRRLALLHMQLQNLVEQLVGREAVLVGLIGPQLGRGRLGENSFGNVGLPQVPPARDPVHHHLRQIRNHRQAAVHVAIQRAVAHRHLGLIPGGQQQRPVFVGKRH